MQVQSVSAWPEKRGEIKKMMQLAAEDIKRLGGEVELVDIGKQMVSVGYTLPMSGGVGWGAKSELVCRLVVFLHAAALRR